MGKTDVGLYDKYEVRRTDGKSAPGEKHHGCRHFVLDLAHDPFAVPAISAYRAACEDKHPKLAADLLEWLKVQKPNGKSPLAMISLSRDDDEPDQVMVSVVFLEGVKVDAMAQIVHTAAHGMLTAAARIIAIKAGCSESKAMRFLTGDAAIEHDDDEEDADDEDGDDED